MNSLTVIDGSILTEYVIRILNNNDIFTVIDFLREPSIKLKNITNIPIKEIGSIKEIFMRKQGIKLRTGLDLYAHNNKISYIIPTGIRSVDVLLDGGLITGSIIEICGLPASGKSQFCNTIAINATYKTNIEVLYVDTKHDFCAKKIRNIMISLCHLEADIGISLQKIRVVRIYTAETLIELLKSLNEGNTTIGRIKIIIIDSLPAAWLSLNGEKYLSGVSLLFEASILMKQIADRFQIIFIIVNVITRWTELLFGDCHSQYSKLPTAKPSLGKYWESVPNARLHIQNHDDKAIESNIGFNNSNNHRSISDYNGQRIRSIKILKSDLHGCNKICHVTITNQGMVAAHIEVQKL